MAPFWKKGGSKPKGKTFKERLEGPFWEGVLGHFIILKGLRGKGGFGGLKFFLKFPFSKGKDFLPGLKGVKGGLEGPYWRGGIYLGKGRFIKGPG